MSTETESRLIAALLKHGNISLAQEMGISSAEISRKINSENGFTLRQLAKALDFVGAQVIPGDENIVVVKRDEWLALRTLARKSLEGEE